MKVHLVLPVFVVAALSLNQQPLAGQLYDMRPMFNNQWRSLMDNVPIPVTSQQPPVIAREATRIRRQPPALAPAPLPQPAGRSVKTGLSAPTARTTGTRRSNQGVYVSLQGGVALTNDSDLTEAGITGAAKFDTGYALNGAFGYIFGSGLRAEGEIGYTKNDMESLSVNVGRFTITATGFNGHVDILSGMANVVFDFPVDGQVKPYLLGGLGIARVGVDIEGTTSDDTVLAGQLGAGANVEINEQVSAGLSYRFFKTADLNFGGTEADYSSNRFMLGLMYKL
jgi:opacity protein-like surface antigen